MIPLLVNVAGQEFRRPLRRLMTGLVTEGVLVGLGFVALMPFLSALLAADYAAALRAWVLLAVILLAYGMLRWRTQLAGYHAAIALSRALFARLGTHIARLPLGWFSEARTGQLAVLSSQGIVNIMVAPAHLLRPMIVAFTTPVVVLVFMAVIDWRLAAAVAIALPLSWLATTWTGRLVERTDRRVHAAATEAAGRIVEFAQAQPVLRAFGRGTSAAADLDAALVEQRNASRAQMRAAAQGFLTFVVVIQAALTLLLVMGVNRALGGAVDVPELAALLVLGLRFAEPLIMAVDLQAAVRVSEANLGRMKRLLATAPLPEPPSPRQPECNDVVLEDVHFSYDGTPVLRGVNFTAAPRGLTALVGPSGAGKTTTLRLMARFFDADSGVVRLGGVDVREIGGQELMDRLAIVFQDVYLFDGTIADNLKIGKPDATEAELRNAIKLAQLEATLARLPHGLDTPVGEGGAALSGGERQRVSIARALLKGAEIVLLDEATAAIDALDEARLRDAIAAIARDRTVIAVAHRLSTVRAADHIVFVENGHVAEQGTHDALLEKDGRYAAFWTLHTTTGITQLPVESARNPPHG